MSLYDDLEVSSDATDEQIKAAYRKLARKHHPDKGGSVEKFQIVQKAYDILSNISRRAQYDKTGQTEQGPDIKAAALQQLAILIFQYIENLDSTIDIIEKVKNDVIVGHGKLDEAIAKLPITKDKYKKALKKFKNKKKKENILARMIEAQIRSLDFKAQELIKQKELGAAMLDILNDYEYQVEQGQQTYIMQTFFVTGQ